MAVWAIASIVYDDRRVPHGLFRYGQSIEDGTSFQNAEDTRTERQLH